MVHPIVQQWLAHLEETGKSRHTLAAYRRALAHFTHWVETTYGTPFEVQAVLGRDVRDWRAYQQTVERAAPATINQRLAALSQFYGWALRGGHVRSDPTGAVSGLPRPARHPKALDRLTLHRLLRRVQADGNARDRALIELMVGTGLRVSELLALKVGDVALGERSGSVTVRYGKRASWRVVPVPREARLALREYMSSHPSPTDPDSALWQGERGPLSDRTAINKLLTEYTRLAGIEGVTPHQLRHTFATRYLEANSGDLRGLAALLGHRSLDTVMVYTEPTMEDLADRVEKIR